mmetsp:Transcript_18087/g.47639  ORF Transcript_18087/g.47639 Transcript_18087/m.47639 type:complete len:266 (-) Transcript_18087:970-1767(-)
MRATLTTRPRDRQRKGHVGIKRHTLVVAHGAREVRSKHALAAIDDQRVVSHQMTTPRLGRHLVVWLAVTALDHLRVGLFLDSVQVLMYPIHQKGHEFLRVLLLVTGELGRELAQRGLELARHDRAVLARPVLVHQLGVRLHELAACTKHVVFVHVTSILALEEELREWLGVGQALQHRVHEASVTKVVQSNRPVRQGRAATAASPTPPTARLRARLVPHRRRVARGARLCVRARRANQLAVNRDPRLSWRGAHQDLLVREDTVFR